MIVITRKFDECVDKIEEKKVLPHKTSDLLKDMEYDDRVIKEEICENLDKEDDKGVKD